MSHRFNGAVHHVGRLAATVLAVISITPLAAVSQDFEWTGRLQPGQIIEINGVIGDIRATAARGDRAEITAEKREGRKGYAEDVEFDVIEHRDGVTICAIYPRNRRNRDNECRAGDRSRLGADDNDTEVTFTIAVPAGVLFSGRTISTFRPMVTRGPRQ